MNRSRRKFIKNTSCAALASTSFYSSILNLKAISSSAITNICNNSNEDYKALVCIMLKGGNDGFNTLIPYSDEHYNHYAVQRTNLAIQRNQLIPITHTNMSQRELALHPSLAALEPLYQNKKMAFVCNVGTLVQPMTKTDLMNGVVAPSGLFSHADQSHHWQTSVPQTNSNTGWLGRISDLVYETNLNQEISMNISLSGKNVIQLGNEISEYSILPIGNGSVGIKGYNGNNTFDQLKTQVVKSLMEQNYKDVFKKTYAETVVSSQNAHELFSTALEVSELQTEFSDTDISQDLKMVARTIQVREQLGMKRQTFYVQMEGWDHHDDLLELQESMLEELSNALVEFQSALAELQIEDCVTSFTISDFGRALHSNGDGSDHAWGSNMIVMGSQVKGQEVYGNYPELISESEYFLDGGIILPRISTDEYFAELAVWFGVPKSDLNYIFPNIGNFYNVFSGSPPIGFMNIE